ncbi:DnaJ domain-containing protein [Lactococcus sp. LG1074]|uniref:DnaJ domain-containing protein n=2 Tax=Lactococcus TaxID=1357 RepID=UPI001F5DF18A|nr:DnaJ domain-containing protein [Lactococcus sp. LG1074]
MEENKHQVEVREEFEIKRYNVFVTLIGVMIVVGATAYFSDKFLYHVPVVGFFLSFLVTFIVILFSFLYVVRRYAFLSLILLILALFSGGIIPIVVLAIGLVALFYSARYFVDKWIGWYIYSYFINTWYFVLSQIPFSLFTEAYLRSQEKKAQAERFRFEEQQREYTRRSQEAYQEWEKQQNSYSDKNESRSYNTYDPYKVLGVTPQTPLSEIKKVYRKLAKAYHPDLNHEEGASEKFKEIQEAWEIIMKK